MKISYHCKQQSELRYLLSELDAGMVKVRSTRLPNDVNGEVNFIVERKTRVLHRKGSSGNLVIIGVDWDRKIVKSIFLQNENQVTDRQSRGRQYCSLLHK